MSWYRNTDNPAVVDHWLYINGELVVPNESEWVDPGDTVFLGGGHSGNDSCNGAFDDFRVYDRALCLEAVKALAFKEQ